MNVNLTQNLWSAKEWARVKATGNEYVTMVHHATNEDKWGPTGAQMENICFVFPRAAMDILEEIRWRLKNRDKSWRACYKSLLLLDYLVRNVQESCLPEICSIVPTLRTISQSFYYTNPKGVDHGLSVRERARKLADLMTDGLELREERVKVAATRAKLARDSSFAGGPGAYGEGVDRYQGFGGRGAYPGVGYGTNSYPHTSSGQYSPSNDMGGRRSTPPVPSTREEQERHDMELALRMQREEERRSGVSAAHLESLYARKAKAKQSSATPSCFATEGADEDLARRLQEEEEERARRAGTTLPSFRSDAPDNGHSVKNTECHTTTQNAVAASKPKAPAASEDPPKPKHDVLDDLFAPAPAPAVPQAATGQAPKYEDPFDSFLDSRAQQQQHPTMQQWGQSAQNMQQANPWNLTAANAWGTGAPAPLQQQPHQGASLSAPSWGQPVPSVGTTPWNCGVDHGATQSIATAPTAPVAQDAVFGDFISSNSSPMHGQVIPPSQYGIQQFPTGNGNPGPMNTFTPSPMYPPQQSWGGSQLQQPQQGTFNAPAASGSANDMWSSLNPFAK